MSAFNTAILFIRYAFLNTIICAVITIALNAQENEIPIVIIHRGNSDYLKHVLWQAKQFNERVILLGDKSNYTLAKSLNVQHYYFSDYSKSANYIGSIYTHLSPISYDFILFALQRWFFLEEFIKANGIPVVFHCDSDVMLYCNITKEYKNFKENDIVLLNRRAGMTSYWKSRHLTEFCTFLKNFYENKKAMQQLVQRFSPRDPSTWYHEDVPLTKMFVTCYQNKFKIDAIDKIIDNAVFDPSLLTPDQWETGCLSDTGYLSYKTKRILLNNKRKIKVKDIRWIKRYPHCYNIKLKKLIRFKSLHFQGPVKELISKYRVQYPG